MFELDPQGTFLNEFGAGRTRIVERYSASSGSPVGRSAFDLYADAPQVIANLRRALAGEAFTGRVDVPGADGTSAVFEVIYSPVMDDAGHLERLVGVALDVTEREAAAHQVVRDAERLRRLAARLQTERESERTRIARAVHDAVGQALTAISLDTNTLIRRLESRQPVDREALLARLHEVSMFVETTLAAVGDLAAELRPPVLDTLGLSAALADAAMRFQTRTLTPCALSASLAPPEAARVPHARATTAFRIVQEALTNVARHAGPCRVEIRLYIAETPLLPHQPRDLAQVITAESVLVVEIEDDGCGLPDGAARASTPGLAGMAERAAQWNGTLYLGPPADGTGTLVRAVLPLGPESADSDANTPRDST